MNLEPVKELALIVQKNKQHLDAIIETAKKAPNGIIKAELLKVANDTSKNTTRDLKNLVDICQKEDDQTIKLAELKIKKADFKLKKDIATGDQDEKELTFTGPTFTEVKDKDGKIKLIKNQNTDA